MRASFSVGFGAVSILICWASAGRAGATTSASRTATAAIRIGMSSSYTKIFRSPRTVGFHADSPRLRLRLAPRPHDVLRLGLYVGSPRTVGPQPHDVLRLGLYVGSPRTVGPQPHDVLRLGLYVGSPRTVGPQPHDVLRLGLYVGSPRTVGPQPHDVLRLG